MRIDPQPKDKAQKKNDPKYIEAITRKVALAVVFASVFAFFLKLLFF